MSTIELSKKSIRKIKKRKYPAVRSTFLTEDGPASGTIWHAIDRPGSQPFIVEDVDPAAWRLVEDGRRIRYADGTFDEFTEFMRCVDKGVYVLIGVKPLNHSHICV